MQNRKIQIDLQQSKIHFYSTGERKAPAGESGRDKTARPRVGEAQGSLDGGVEVEPGEEDQLRCGRQGAVRLQLGREQRAGQQGGRREHRQVGHRPQTNTSRVLRLNNTQEIR